MLTKENSKKKKGERGKNLLKRERLVEAFGKAKNVEN